MIFLASREPREQQLQLWQILDRILRIRQTFHMKSTKKMHLVNECVCLYLCVCVLVCACVCLCTCCSGMLEFNWNRMPCWFRTQAECINIIESKPSRIEFSRVGAIDTYSTHTHTHSNTHTNTWKSQSSATTETGAGAAAASSSSSTTCRASTHAYCDDWANTLTARTSS